MIIEQIRDLRLRNGSWTLDRYRTEIGEPPVGDGGDVPVLVERQAIIAWEDIKKYSDAEIAQLVAAGQPPQPVPPRSRVTPGHRRRRALRGSRRR